MGEGDYVLHVTRKGPLIEHARVSNKPARKPLAFGAVGSRSYIHSAVRRIEQLGKLSSVALANGAGGLQGGVGCVSDRESWRGHAGLGRGQIPDVNGVELEGSAIVIVHRGLDPFIDLCCGSERFEQSDDLLAGEIPFIVGLFTATQPSATRRRRRVRSQR